MSTLIGFVLLDVMVLASILHDRYHFRKLHRQLDDILALRRREFEEFYRTLSR